MTAPSVQAVMDRLDRQMLASLSVPPPNVRPHPRDPYTGRVLQMLRLGYFGDPLGNGYGYPGSTVEAVLGLIPGSRGRKQAERSSLAKPAYEQVTDGDL